MNYCESCLTRHDKNPIFKDHRVLDKTAESSNEAFCKVHRGEQVKIVIDKIVIAEEGISHIHNHFFFPLQKYEYHSK